MVDSEHISESMLAKFAGFIAPIFRPLGLGSYEVPTALITGVVAKESVVSTLEVLSVGADSFLSTMTGLSAMCLLVFSLLYTPCFASIAAIKRELGHKWAIGIVIFQCVIAYIAALIVRLIGLLFGLA